MPDYVARPEDIVSGAVSKYNANMDALRLGKRLEAEGRVPTPEEQSILARYSGWGDSGLANRVFGYTSEEGWRARAQELRELLDDDEYHFARGSTLNAFYTNPEIVDTVWTALRTMGAGDLETIRVLEPSAGAGRFLTGMPKDLEAKSQRTAIELDKGTGVVLRGLLPDSTVYTGVGYENVEIPDNSVDIAVSNVPFGSYGIVDLKYPFEPYIHNYFFLRTMDKLRPGGVMAYITSAGTLNADNEQARATRETLYRDGDLVAAVRLPSKAFPDTDVVTDIIFLRKRFPDEEPGDSTWLKARQQTFPNEYGENKRQTVNEYFVKNPEFVLGEQKSTGSMRGHGENYNVEIASGGPPIEQLIEDATVRAAARAPQIPSRAMAEAALARGPAGFLASGSGRPEGEYYVGSDGELMKVQGGQDVPAGLPKQDEDRYRRLIAMGELGRELLDLEKSGEPDDVVDGLRAVLRGQYEEFRGKYGEINSTTKGGQTKNRTVSNRLADAAFIRALEAPTEEWDEEKKEEVRGWKPASLFVKRMLNAQPEEGSFETPADAMVASINRNGSLDFAWMGEVLGGRSPKSVADDLSDEGLIFYDPESQGWQTADRYLSGNVRHKLRVAQAAVDAGAAEAFSRNVEALKPVQPENVSLHDIRTNLGAGWIPPDVVNQYSDHLGIKARYFYDPTVAVWEKVAGYTGADDAAYAKWSYQKGRVAIGPSEMLRLALMGRAPRITEKVVGSDGKDKQIPDRDAIEAVSEKLGELREDFSRWVVQDPERVDRLSEIYNEHNNNLRAREYSGGHQTFPGMSVKWQKGMYPHQRDAIYRGVQDGTALLAHEVGFGKTAVMVAIGMERKRMGLSEKPLFVVPKATYEQFLGQFRDIYPGANVLAPEPGTFSGKNRRPFIYRAQTGDWDAIVMTMEQFESIPMRPGTEINFINQQLDEHREALENAVREGNKKSVRVKAIEESIKKLEKRLQTRRLEQLERKDFGVDYFEDMGVDQIIVDEADNYKNLGFQTDLENVKGLNPSSNANRARDMFVKSQWLLGSYLTPEDEARRAAEAESGRFKTRGVVFATGTPVSNSVAEAWTMMRYLQLEELRKRNLDVFDAWQRSHSLVESRLEPTAAGSYKDQERLAKFYNLPELAGLFQMVADIRVRAETPEIRKRDPKLVGGESEDNPRIRVVSPPTAQFMEYMDSLQERAAEVASGAVRPDEDNMLKILSDGRKASLDLRMVNPYAARAPKGKIPLLADNVAEVYEDETPDKGTQLIFLDLGTPQAVKGSDGAQRGGDDGEDKSVEVIEDAETSALLKNLYSQIRSELVVRGIPTEEIAFIHDAKNDKQRQEMFYKLREGKLRVLVGSTNKAGVGVNVQDRAAALHHVDVPWRPRDIEQREGRVIRQGNRVYGPVMAEDGETVVDEGRGVKIFTYVQQGSVDEFMWNLINKKAGSIKQILRRAVPREEIEEADEVELDARTLQAAAAGDPRVLDLMSAQGRLESARRSQRTHAQERDRIETTIAKLEDGIARREWLLPMLEEDAATAAVSLAQEIPEKSIPSVRIGKETPGSGAKVAEALGKFATQKVGFGTEEQYAGKFRDDWDIYVRWFGVGYRAALRSPKTGQFYWMTGDAVPPEKLAGADWLRRLNNILSGIENRKNVTAGELTSNRSALVANLGERKGDFQGGAAIEHESRLVRLLEQDIKLNPYEAVWDGGDLGGYTPFGVGSGVERPSARIARERLEERTLAAEREKALAERLSQAVEGDTGLDSYLALDLPLAPSPVSLNMSDEEILAEATEEEFATARAEVQRRALEGLSTGGRDYVVPTAEEIEAQTARSVLEQRRKHLEERFRETERERQMEEARKALEMDAANVAAAQSATAAVLGQLVEQEPESSPPDDAVTTESENQADEIAGMVEEAISKDGNVRVSAAEIEEKTDATADVVASDLAEVVPPVVEDADRPAMVSVDRNAEGDEPAVTVATIEPQEDFANEEAAEVINRVEDRIQEDSAEQWEDDNKVQVFTVADTDAMILDEVASEVADRDDATPLAYVTPEEFVAALQEEKAETGLESGTSESQVDRLLSTVQPAVAPVTPIQGGEPVSILSPDFLEDSEREPLEKRLTGTGLRRLLEQLREIDPELAKEHGFGRRKNIDKMSSPMLMGIARRLPESELINNLVDTLLATDMPPAPRVNETVPEPETVSVETLPAPEPETVPSPAREDSDDEQLRRVVSRNIENATYDGLDVAQAQTLYDAGDYDAATKELKEAEKRRAAAIAADWELSAEDPGAAQAQSGNLGMMEGYDPDTHMPITKEARAIEAKERVPLLNPENREAYEDWKDRLGDVLDDYDLIELALRVGPNPDAETVIAEEARVRRQHELGIGQADIFGATAEDPAALVSPEPPAPPKKPRSRRIRKETTEITPPADGETSEGDATRRRRPLRAVKPELSDERLVSVAGNLKDKAAAARAASPMETPRRQSGGSGQRRKASDKPRAPKTQTATAEKQGGMAPWRRATKRKHGLK